MAVVAEEDQWRNHGEAWVEGVLSLTEAQGDPWEGHMLWVAHPSEEEGACWEAGGHAVDSTQEEQEVVAPYQEGQEGAWASEAFLDACCQEERVVVQEEEHQHHPVVLVSLLLEACPSQTLMEALILEEEQAGKHQGVAYRAYPFLLPVWSEQVLGH